MLLLRRYLVLAALFFWQGGFTFYAAVVVPVGQEVFGHRPQGFVTRRVTLFLNLSGAAAAALLAWDLFGKGDPSRCRRRARAGLWLVLAGTLAVLFALHARLDSLLDPEAFDLADPRTFRRGHRLYLWISTVQWAAAVVYLALTLRAWRAEDREEPAAAREDPNAKKSAEEVAIPR
jgi:Na+-driven multidrug efflux pump